jgi:adenosyl cobinamide kinase/adenosyl cobinamide phosphate guanylyltransferase
MIFITGGLGAGKYERVLDLGYRPEEIFQGGADDPATLTDCRVLYKLNQLVRRLMQQDLEIEKALSGLSLHRLDVVVCDEVGCGVVPADPQERQYREEVGRAACRLAGEAERVERMVCGIPVVIR